MIPLSLPEFASRLLCFTVIFVSALITSATLVAQEPGTGSPGRGVRAENVAFTRSIRKFLAVDPFRGQGIPDQYFAKVFRSVWDPVSEAGTGFLEFRSSQDPIPVSDFGALREKAEARLAVLRGRQQPLTADDTGDFWRVLMSMNVESDEERRVFVQLYESLGELPLSARDRMEVCRFLGQEYFRREQIDRAAAMLERGILTYDQAEPDEKKALAGTMAMILNFNSSLLSCNGQDELEAANSRRLLEDPELRAELNVGALISLSERIGDFLLRNKRYPEAINRYQQGKEFAANADDEKYWKRSAVRLSLKEFRGDALARDLPPEEIAKGLEELKEKFAGGQFESWEFILRELVVCYDKLGNREAFIASLRELRDFLLANVRSMPPGSLDGQVREDLLDSTKLLVQALLDGVDRDEATAIFLETCKELAPPRYWTDSFPEDFVREALSRSVVEPGSDK